jgi:hypothetical protein
MAGDRTFNPWTVSVYNTTDFLIRDALEAWQNGIANFDATQGILNPAEYQVDMLVHQLDRNDAVLKSYKFYGVYPTSIGEISLDFESNNEIEIFETEFTYAYHTPL